MSNLPNIRPPFNVALDLSVARDRVEIVPPGVYVSQWKVTLLTAGSTLRVHLGREGDGIAVNPADSMTFPQAFANGLYVTNPAQPGINAELAIIPGSKA